MTTPVLTQAAKTAAAGELQVPAGRGRAAARPKAPARPKPSRTRPPAARASAPAAPRTRRSSQGSAARAPRSRGFAMGAGKPGGSTGVVAAEFAACIILIGISPIATRHEDGTGHLYKANDFVRLSAVSLLFFILALLSSTPRGGKAAAAFGGLVTLGVVFNARATFTAIGSIFAGASRAGGVVNTADAGTATVDAPTFTPVDLSGNPLSQAGAHTGAPASSAAASGA